MQVPDAHFKIIREGNKLISVSVNMPIWSRVSEHGNWIVDIPMLMIDTISNDEKDAEIAVEEAIISFCHVAEKFGQGVERELEVLGWMPVDGESGEPILGYGTSNPDAVLNRILQTGENYVNPHLEISE